MTSRNQEHYLIMSVLYKILLTQQERKDSTFLNPTEVIDEICEDEKTPYIENVVYNALAHYKEIREAIDPKLKSWKWNRLPLLTRSILLMSYSNYYYVDKPDKRIVIDVAVNLAKKYVDDKQAKFINALLDGVLNEN